MYSRVLLNHVHWRLLEVDRFFSMDDGVCGGDFWQRTNGSDFFMFISRWQAKDIHVTLGTVSSTYFSQWMYWKAKTKPMHIKYKGDSFALHWAGGRRVFMLEQLPETKIKRVMFQYFIIIYYNLQHSGSGCLFVLNVMSKFQCVIICCESEVRTSNMFQKNQRLSMCLLANTKDTHIPKGTLSIDIKPVMFTIYVNRDSNRVQTV